MVTDAPSVSGDTVTREGFRTLAKDADLDGVDLRVLLYLLSFIDSENYTLVQQKDIAEELGRRPQHISRSIKKLEDKGIIIAAPRVGKSNAWRLNPRYK
jgi:DNA-binding MarR family transcriptional regulator